MASTAPSLESTAHVAITVTDVVASTSWYERVMGFETVVDVPHDGGHGVVMATPDRRVWWAVHHHTRNRREAFDETRTGLDHVGLLVSSLAELDRWEGWLVSQGVPHDPVRPLPDFGMAALVLRDPDGIPIELLTYVHADPG